MNTDIIVLFFCLGLIMLFFSIIFFVISIKYRKDKKINFNIEEEKMEIQAILFDAKELMKQIDEYSGIVINKMDERLDEMEKMCIEIKTLKNESIKNIEIKKSNQNNKNEEINKLDENSNNEKTNKMDKEKAVIKIANPLHKKIMDMYNSGIHIEGISKNLNMGKGEVTLIIKRYKNFS